ILLLRAALILARVSAGQGLPLRVAAILARVSADIVDFGGGRFGLGGGFGYRPSRTAFTGVSPRFSRAGTIASTRCRQGPSRRSTIAWVSAFEVATRSRGSTARTAQRDRTIQAARLRPA